MTTPQTPSGRTGVDITRGMSAALALVAFVVGVPVALVALAPVYLPQPPPGWRQLWDRVVSPDDGSLLLLVLAAVAWINWAAFTATVLVELVAAARRLRAPTIPLLGGFQRTAERLLTTAGLLLATTTSIAMPAGPAHAVSTLVVPLDHEALPSATAETHTTAPPADMTPATATASADAAALRTVTVQRGDTLWDIAERHLGDPLRYTEIRDLNVGRTQPDGHRLRDADWIQPGWVLLLPADATNADPPAGPTSALVAAESSVVVRPGDTLSTIAEAHLGDGARYPEIAELNHDVTQPDGMRLTDPNLIRPGWVLRLPDETTTITRPATRADAAAGPTDSGLVATPPKAAPPGNGPASPPPEAWAAAAGPAPSPEATNDEAVPATAEHRPVKEARSSSTWFLGLSALGAVGIVGEIARRRHLQQRARKVGETIPLPDPRSPAAAAERTLRAAATPVSIEAIRTTLANVGCRRFDSGRDLPRVGALLLDEQHLTLLLVDDSPDAVAPFTATNPRTWVATTTDVAAQQPIDDPDQCTPYPLLVALGHTDDATLIANLEAAGTLSIVGDDTAAEDALRALVLETATSDLASQLAVHVDEPLADLEGAFEDFRLSATDDRDDRASTETQIAQTLAETGHDDTLQLRGDRQLDDLWLPYMYVEHSLRATPSAPWSGIVTITREPTEAGWTIDVAADGSARLQPLGIDYQPQRLSDEHMAHLRSVLMIALPPESRRTPPELATTVAEDLDAMQAAHPPIDSTPSDEPTVTINVLGPIEIRGLPPGKKPLTPFMKELLVYLALHGPATGSDLDEALWNGQRIDPQTRATAVHRTRQRTGEEVLPVVGRWLPLHLGDTVTTDWAQFQQLVADALTHDGQERIDGLTQALALVRDRPFRGIEGSGYTWADYDIQHMTSSIADAAQVLTRLRTESGDTRGAIESAMLGLAAEPFSEALQQLAVAATQAAAGGQVPRRGVWRFPRDLRVQALSAGSWGAVTSWGSGTAVRRDRPRTSRAR